MARRLGCLLAMVVVVLAATTADAQSPPRVGPETPVTPQDLRHMWGFNSPVLAADPTEPRFVALATRLDSPDFSCALYLSGDAGRSWVPARTTGKLPDGAEKCYAPEVAFDAAGKLYYLFVGLAGRGNQPMGAFLATSADRGRTFSPPRRVLGPRNFAVRMAVDAAAGPHGRIHLAWLHASADPPAGGLPTPPNPILAAHSDDGGRTFSEPVQVSDPGRERVVAPALAVGPRGAVHVVYYDLEDDALDYQGLEGPVWEGAWSLVAASSSDGGRSFSAGVVVDDAVVPGERVMLVFTMPAPAIAAGPDGSVFVAWHDARRGDRDVFLRRSGDAGRTWEGPHRLNDDAVGNGRHQYLPRLSVSQEGRLDAVFYDRRDDADNLRNHVWFTWSTDSGRSFAPNLRLTSEPSDTRVGQRYLHASALGQFEIGSRLGLISTATGAVAAWTDTRNSFQGTAAQSVFSTPVTLGDAGGDGGGGREPEGARSWPPLVGLVSALLAGAGVAAVRRVHR